MSASAIRKKREVGRRPIMYMLIAPEKLPEPLKIKRPDDRDSKGGVASNGKTDGKQTGAAPKSQPQPAQ